MNGQTVFNAIEPKPEIVRSDFRMTNDVMSDYVIGYYIIVKMVKLAHYFLGKGWVRRWPEYRQVLSKYELYG